jgi:hypothetical protein
MSYIMELSFSASDETLVFLDSSTLDGVYLILKEEDGTPNAKEIARLGMDDDDLERLGRMIEMVKLQRKQEMEIENKQCN